MVDYSGAARLIGSLLGLLITWIIRENKLGELIKPFMRPAARRQPFYAKLETPETIADAKRILVFLSSNDYNRWMIGTKLLAAPCMMLFVAIGALFNLESAQDPAFIPYYMSGMAMGGGIFLLITLYYVMQSRSIRKGAFFDEKTEEEIMEMARKRAEAYNRFEESLGRKIKEADVCFFRAS